MTVKEKLDKTLKNLEFVYNELPKLAERTPSIKTEFDMGTYGCFETNILGETKCKTYGCLLGNIARLFDISNPKYYYYQEFDYSKFGKEEFPYLYIKSKMVSWGFLFNMLWNDKQPTFDQAMERVKYFLDKKGNIGEWEFQEESFKA